MARKLSREKCRIWFSYEPPLFTDFSIIDEGKVPFLMSLPQMKNLGVSLDLRGTPERILFHTGFLKEQGVPLHRNRAGHLTLDVVEICKKAKASAHKGGQLHAASSFPATADEPSEIPSVSLTRCTATDSCRAGDSTASYREEIPIASRAESAASTAAPTCRREEQA